MKKHFKEHIDKLVKEFEESIVCNHDSYEDYIKIRNAKIAYRSILNKFVEDEDDHINYTITHEYDEYVNNVENPDKLEDIVNNKIQKTHEKLKKEVTYPFMLKCGNEWN
jgi:hypothetical protein